MSTPQQQYPLRNCLSLEMHDERERERVEDFGRASLHNSIELDEKLQGRLNNPGFMMRLLLDPDGGRRMSLGRSIGQNGSSALPSERSAPKQKLSLYERILSFLRGTHLEFWVWGLTAINIAVIVTNVILTSHQEHELWDHDAVVNAIWVFMWIERVMVNLFFVEIVLKISFLRREFFREPYNYYDAFVCIFSWIFWLVAFILFEMDQMKNNSENYDNVVESVARKLIIFRMVRLTRVAAIVGWIPALRELWLLISAFGSSLKILCFGMVLFIVLSVSFAAIMTTVVNSDHKMFPPQLCAMYTETHSFLHGMRVNCDDETDMERLHGSTDAELNYLTQCLTQFADKCSGITAEYLNECLNSVDQADKEACHSELSSTYGNSDCPCISGVVDDDGLCHSCQNFFMFRNSFISFIRIITLEGWPDVVDPVTRRRPWTAFVFAVFIGISAYAVVNLLTAVLVDSAMTVSGGTKALDQIEFFRSTNALRKLFLSTKDNKEGGGEQKTKGSSDNVPFEGNEGGETAADRPSPSTAAPIVNRESRSAAAAALPEEMNPTAEAEGEKEIPPTANTRSVLLTGMPSHSGEEVGGPAEGEGETAVGGVALSAGVAEPQAEFEVLSVDSHRLEAAIAAVSPLQSPKRFSSSDSAQLDERGTEHFLEEGLSQSLARLGTRGKAFDRTDTGNLSLTNRDEDPEADGDLLYDTAGGRSQSDVSRHFQQRRTDRAPNQLQAQNTQASDLSVDLPGGPPGDAVLSQAQTEEALARLATATRRHDSEVVTWKDLRCMLDVGGEKFPKILDRFGLDEADLRRVYYVSLFEMHPLSSQNLNRKDDPGVPLAFLVHNMQKYKHKGTATPKDILDVLFHIPSLKLQILLLNKDVQESVRHSSVVQDSMRGLELRLDRTERLLVNIKDRLVQRGDICLPPPGTARGREDSRGVHFGEHQGGGLGLRSGGQVRGQGSYMRSRSLGVPASSSSMRLRAGRSSM
uniref:Ion transport domain-containing protein n=1 Tax=Chromera velia CCMP2878 TaxID=1169474 RepID=A0A0K6S789_9ALVE|eukprot:Cvel_20170.t2-p1 / transcript=Cvel_20170.t2 / gene=Cvel_20170 / organism=Chromera_velia_CCMP2878 / gene_product=hypothetical protein / transcript_product=hypothetical protein / location=Cvel_scaffold1792:19129-24202(+) / protein_length=979 / sequence_SO=supercontig / SO=protein_coding / is_pseudo=false